jgi:hypothetical protein
MTFSTSSLARHSFAAFGALFASYVFISAAIGPVLA